MDSKCCRSISAAVTLVFFGGCTVDERAPSVGEADSGRSVSVAPVNPLEDGGAPLNAPSVEEQLDASVPGERPPVLEPCSADAGCAPLLDAGLCPQGEAACAAACPGCWIDSECVAVEQAHPDNPCLWCDPESDSLAWSNAPSECDDGGNALCDVESDQCVSTCDGCVIDGSCVALGALNPANPCLICDPARSSVNYSPNVAATCGQGPSQCSDQDTCNAQGQCEANDLPNGQACGAGGALFCIAGSCLACGDAPNPNALCAAQSAATPLCDGDSGQCVACSSTSCGGVTPHCEPLAGCQPCTEHSHCPGTACHLSGPLQGSCFATGDVVQVSTPAQLITQIGILLPARPSVIRLAPTTFTTDAFLDISGDGVEVAIIGQQGTVLSGGPTNGTPFLMSVGFDATAYLSGVTFRNGPTNALGSSQGSTLWVDDVDISGYPNIGLVGTGEGHVRRSRITAEGAAMRWQGGSLFMENSAVGMGALIGLSTLNSPVIDITYSTIAGNQETLNCNASPGPSGQIRNSILVGTDPPSIGGNACDLLSYEDNAVDEAGFGTVVGGFDESWFVNAALGNFHLTAAGAAALGNIARRGPNDPPLDIDGEPRPTQGSPGLDQP